MSSGAVSFDLIEESRSAWSMSRPRLLPSLRIVFSITPARQSRARAQGDIPADDVAAVHVEYRVEVVLARRRPPFEFGDVP